MAMATINFHNITNIRFTDILVMLASERKDGGGRFSSRTMIITDVDGKVDYIDLYGTCKEDLMTADEIKLASMRNPKMAANDNGSDYGNGYDDAAKNYWQPGKINYTI